MTDAPRNDREKTRGRPFTPGNAGKPRGAISHVTRAAQELLDGEAEKLSRKAVDLALAGDVTALKICLDRVLPVRKGRPVTLDLPHVQTASDVAAAMAALTQAMAAGGDITPDEAAVIASVLEVRRKAIETVELERRIAELEAREARER